MALPEQIRKQSEAIAKHYEEINADAVQETGAGEDASVGEEANGAADPAPEAALNEKKRPATTVDETAEQRYRTLQGMYNADTARLRADKQELASRVEQLERLLSSLSSAPAQSTASFASNEKLITDKDIEDYGDSIEVMRRVSKEETIASQRKIAELEKLIRDLQVQVVPRVEAVAQRQAKSAADAFWTDLTAVVPNWRDINQNKDFHAWLLEVDPLTGVNRQTHLADAQKNLDVRRVAAFFSTWQGNTGHSIAHEPRDVAKSQLEKQVAPGRGRTAAAPSAPQSKTYSAEDIKKFFNDVRRGAFKGRETERDRIERDIFAAQREGRIVANG
ncbi:MAG: hypothetical protein ABFE08_17825 [Armatimonadia bacterium]